MAEHINAGDFARWAKQAKDAVTSATSEASQQVREGLHESANVIEGAVREIESDPMEAARDAMTAVEEAVETGELPIP